MDVIYGFHWRFHYEISLQCSLWISTANFILNPPDFIIDFMAISLHLPGFHWNQQDLMKSTVFNRISLKSTGLSLWISLWIPFQWQIHGFHAWNLADFMKSTGFHAWNPQNQYNSIKTLHFHKCRGRLVYEIMKSGRFHVDFTWNPPIQQDFTKSNRMSQDSWNQQNLTQFHKIQHNFTKTTGFIEIQRFQRI